MGAASKWDKAAYNREYMRRRRLERKLAGRCIDCNADLGDDESCRCRGCLGKRPEREWTAADNARKTRERHAREAKGQCSWCMAPATCGRLCYGHRQKANAAMRRARARRRAAKPPDLTGSRMRLLRAVSRLDWPTSGEIADALELPEDGHAPERNAAMQMLSRLVRMGLIEARGTHGQRQYAITEHGRAEMRSGARSRAPLTTQPLSQPLRRTA